MKLIFLMTLVAYVPNQEPRSTTLIMESQRSCDRLRGKIGLRRKDGIARAGEWSVAFCTPVRIKQ